MMRIAGARPRARPIAGRCRARHSGLRIRLGRPDRRHRRSARLAGLVLLRGRRRPTVPSLPHPVDRAVADRRHCRCSSPFCFGLPVVEAAAPSHALALFDVFYRTGSLVFGGGHVVLPLLQAAVVPPGWVRTMHFPRRLWRGAGGAGTAVHVLGLSRHRHDTPPQRLARRDAVPRRACSCRHSFWSSARCRSGIRCAIAPGRKPHCAASMPRWSAFCSPRFIGPVWTSGITNADDFGSGLSPFCCCSMWRTPPWLVVAFLRARRRGAGAHADGTRRPARSAASQTLR